MDVLKAEIKKTLLAAVWLLLSLCEVMGAQDFIDLQSVIGLTCRTNSDDVVLMWPSTRREQFVVLWRADVSLQARWVILTNHLATSNRRKTSFRDIGALDRSPAMKTNANLARFYCVFAIPDFSFDMEGVTLSGGPKNPEKDFLPIRYDTNWTGVFEPQIILLVDGSNDRCDSSGTERVNFGTMKKPLWKDTPGVWFWHYLVPKGEHTLQLLSSLSMNNIIGEPSQIIDISGEPVRVRVNQTTDSKGRTVDTWWDKRLGREFVQRPPPFPTFSPMLQTNLDVKSPASSSAKMPDETTVTNQSMKLDLGDKSRFIQVTADYSKAVLAALLPVFSDAAQKLDLPVPQPITQNDVAGFHVLPFGELTASMRLKDGWIFNYGSGCVQDFSSPNSYFNLQDPDQIPKYFGQVNMKPDEAIGLARITLRKLNIPLEDVFADQEPQVTPLVKIETNTVPRYDVTWIDPYGSKSAEFEVNAESKRIERMHLHSWNLHRPPPTINQPAVMMPSDWPAVNPEYAKQLIPLMFQAISAYAEKLSLPILLPLTTNNVAFVEIHDNGGWPHAEITLTNGWRFIYRHTMVNGYYAPDAFVTSVGHPLHVKEVEGKWNLTTNQAVDLVKKTLAKLDFPTNNIHMDFAPNIIFPAGDFRKTIPRYFFEWHYENPTHDDLQSKVEAEVNADNGKLESLYYDDKAYWGIRPPIDAPISIK